jgi:NNP family nitrate/nitrite transporter-like MFS transporter
VGGAAGWIGGIGAFGGFVIPPILGLFVRQLGSPGYALGFVTFVLLAILSLAVAIILRQAHQAAEPGQAALSHSE